MSVEKSRIEKLQEKFETYGQEHVFRFFNQLPVDQQEKLLIQLETIDLKLLSNLATESILANKKPQKRGEFIPADVIPIPRTSEQLKKAEGAKKVGEDLLCSGKVGAVLVAGGQGTRLGFSGPKGKFPVTPVRKKSLFQFHSEKILALSKKYQCSIPWYIMTSEINHTETKQFFEENNYFGLQQTEVFFFQQEMIPGVDENGKFFLASKDRIFANPNGHGGTLQALKNSGALADMKERGIEELFYFQVDNTLIQICDPVFLGYHVREKAEMSSKVLAKRDPYEKIGVIGYLNEKLTVIEYSDLSNEEMEAKNADGSLRFNAGSIAIHMINRNFIEKLADGRLNLPYHLAHKKIPFMDESGVQISPDHPNGYKFEMYIFDALQFTTNSVVMEVERTQEFSPVKNAEGEDSPETAVNDLCNYYGKWLEKSGVAVEKHNGSVNGKLEISPLFAMDENEFVKKKPENLCFSKTLYLG